MSNNTTSKNAVTNTLTPSAVDVVLLTNPAFGCIVENLTCNAPIWFTVSAPGGPGTAPVVPSGGASVGAQYAVGGSVGPTSLSVRGPAQFGQVIQLVSINAEQYTVSVLGNQANV